MTFYSFREIRERGDCRIIAAELHHSPIKDGRCAATWRGGTNQASVAVGEKDFFDHGGPKSGGGVLEFASLAFGGDKQRAQEWCGQRFGCTPKSKTVQALPENSRYEKFLADGYTETARYLYRDIDATNTVRHLKVRLEHPERKKEFVQGVPDTTKPHGARWGIKGVETILYRLPELQHAAWVLLVEGEKSADYMASLGVPVTTTTGGAGHWRDSYTAALFGKHVAIAADNDAVGVQHAETVAAALHGHAASVRVIPPQLPDVPKSGIDDWAQTGFPPKDESDVLDLIARCREWAPPSTGETSADDDYSPERLAEAKQANTIPFSNFVPVAGVKIVRGKEVPEITKEPRCHNDMLRDLQRRFLGFPRMDGGSLFDHDRDSGRIIKIRETPDFISWIDRRSKRPVVWAHGDSFGSKNEFLASVRATARRYEGIAYTPDWPTRTDIYYAHDATPPPCPVHSRFKTFLGFFSPASDADRRLLAAFICAPLWHVPGIPHPSWIIDSQDGAESGKTKVVELVAKLYASEPIRTSQAELGYDIKRLIGRLLSSEGRTGKIVLVDNVTGEFRSPGLSDLITADSISGQAPYGHGEEKRPNNLIYTITANSAQVDSDLAIRSFYIMVRKPKKSAMWLTNAQNFIQKNRLEIISDIIDILSKHTPFSDEPSTRFPEFEQRILQAVCATPEAYAEVAERLSESRAESNTEGQIATAITETITQRLCDLNILSGAPIFIRSEVINSWCGKPIRDIIDFRPKPIQMVRNLAKLRMIQQIDPSVSRWPKNHAKKCYHGVLWSGGKAVPSCMPVVGVDHHGAITVTEE